VSEEIQPQRMEDALDEVGEEEKAAASVDGRTFAQDSFGDDHEIGQFFAEYPEFVKGFLRYVIGAEVPILSDDTTIYDFALPFDDEGNYISNESQRAQLLIDWEKEILYRVKENYGVELEVSDLEEIQGNLLKIMKRVARESSPQS
jgi:hypothetical protein